MTEVMVVEDSQMQVWFLPAATQDGWAADAARSAGQEFIQVRPELLAAWEWASKVKDELTRTILEEGRNSA